MITEPAKTFSRMFRGYDPAAVYAYIEVLITKQQLQLDDVESLDYTRLREDLTRERSRYWQRLEEAARGRGDQGVGGGLGTGHSVGAGHDRSPHRR